MFGKVGNCWVLLSSVADNLSMRNTRERKYLCSPKTWNMALLELEVYESWKVCSKKTQALNIFHIPKQSTP